MQKYEPYVYNTPKTYAPQRYTLRDHGNHREGASAQITRHYLTSSAILDTSTMTSLEEAQQRISNLINELSREKDELQKREAKLQDDRRKQVFPATCIPSRKTDIFA